MKILDIKGNFSLQKETKIFSSWIKLPTTLSYMIRAHKIYILEWSKKSKLNITLITHLFETVNPNICRFQWLENIFLSIIFAVQFFNQKTPNGTTKNYFLLENIKSNINNFDGN